MTSQAKRVGANVHSFRPGDIHTHMIWPYLTMNEFPDDLPSQKKKKKKIE